MMTVIYNSKNEVPTQQEFNSVVDGLESEGFIAYAVKQEPFVMIIKLATEGQNIPVEHIEKLEKNNYRLSVELIEQQQFWGV